MSRGINLDPTTWALLERMIDQTPRANRARIIEDLIWRQAAELGIAGAEAVKKARRDGLLLSESA